MSTTQPIPRAPGFDGEDMTLEPIPKEERAAKLGEAGYNPMNEDTRRRKWASRFHKNIIRGWWKDREKNKRRIIAAETYLRHAEKLSNGYSHNGYEDSPPPDHYEPKTFPNIGRVKATRWFARMERSIGTLHATRIRRAVLDQMTVPQIFAMENPYGKKSQRTAYRDGWRNINASFDRLADFLDRY